MECLKAEGVDAVFGIPGGANLPTYDALYDAGIRDILCRHEQGAGHADEGYAKASGTVGFQEADTIGITMPIVKHSFQVLDPREIPSMIHEAFHLARTGRPGPVLVDIPQDLSRADIPYDPSEAAEVDLPGYKNFEEGNVK